MKKNIGTVDRLLRLALGIILLIAAYWVGSWILLVLGVFCLFEAAFSWCLLYQLLGRNSCSTKK